MDLSFLIQFAPLVVSYAGQWLKAHKAIPTVVAQLLLLAVGVGFYFTAHPYSAENSQWLRDAVMWAFALPGLSSVAASVGVAPKTDSK